MFVVEVEHYLKAAICPPHESIKAGIVQRVAFLMTGHTGGDRAIMIASASPWSLSIDDAIARAFFRYKNAPHPLCFTFNLPQPQSYPVFLIFPE